MEHGAGETELGRATCGETIKTPFLLLLLITLLFVMKRFDYRGCRHGNISSQTSTSKMAESATTDPTRAMLGWNFKGKELYFGLIRSEVVFVVEDFRWCVKDNVRDFGSEVNQSHPR